MTTRTRMLFFLCTLITICLFFSNALAQNQNLTMSESCTEYFTTGLGSNRVLGITLRPSKFAPQFSENLLDEQGKIFNLTSSLKEKYGFDVRFYFTAPIVGDELCRSTRSVNSFGLEVVNCPGAPEIEPSPTIPTDDEDKYCGNQVSNVVMNAYAFSSFFTDDNAVVDDVLFDNIVSFFGDQLIQHFELNTSTCDHLNLLDPNSRCFPTKDAEFCGDGFVTGDEQCDPNPFYALSNLLVDNSMLQSLCNCSVATPGLYIAQDGLLQRAIISWDTFECQGYCGRYEATFVGMQCVGGLDVDYCYKYIGVAPPPAPTTTLQCFVSGGQPCESKQPQWVCRGTDTSTWGACGAAQNWDLSHYYRQDPTKSTQPIPTWPSEPKCAAINKTTNARDIIPTKYWLTRQVSCMIPGTPYNFSLNDCPGGEDYATSLALKSQNIIKPCQELAEYYYPFETLISVTDETELDNIEVDIASYQIAKGFAIPRKPWACNITYRRRIRCLNYDQFSGLPHSITTELCLSSYYPGVINPLNVAGSAVTLSDEEGRCFFSWGGSPDGFISLENPDATQCGCEYLEKDITPSCWGFDPFSLAYLRTDNVTKCRGSPGWGGVTGRNETRSIDCSITNIDNSCYENVCKDASLSTNPWVDCDLLTSDVKYCAVSPSAEDQCGAGLIRDDVVEQACSIYQPRIDFDFVNFLPAPSEAVCGGDRTTCDIPCNPHWECTYEVDMDKVVGGFTQNDFVSWGYTPMNFATHHNPFYCQMPTRPPVGLDDYCGTLPFKRTARCMVYNAITGEYQERPDAECQVEEEKPALEFNYVFNTTNTCISSCFDHRTDKHIGECRHAFDFEALPFGEAHCGFDDVNQFVEPLTMSVQNFTAKCTWYSSKLQQYIPVVAQNGEDIDTMSSYCAPHGVSPAFTWNRANRITEGWHYAIGCVNFGEGLVATRANVRQFLFALQDKTANVPLSPQSSGARFKLECKYAYFNTTLQLENYTDPNSIEYKYLLANDFSSANCEVDFNCQQGDVCGTVERSSRCVAYFGGEIPEDEFGNVHMPDNTTIPPPTVQRVDGVDVFRPWIDHKFGVDFDQYFRAKVNNPEFREFRSALTTLILDITTNKFNPCGTFVEQTCQAQDNCFQRQCHLPSTIPKVGEWGSVIEPPAEPPTDPTQPWAYTADQCKEKDQQAFCESDVQRPSEQCGRYLLPVFQTCWSRWDQRYTTIENCIEDAPEIIQNVTMQCTFFNDCIFENQYCGFKLDETNQVLRDTESAELCTSLYTEEYQDDDDNNNTTPFSCDNVDLCGSGHPYTRCVLQVPSNRTQKFDLSDTECNEHFGVNGKYYTKHETSPLLFKPIQVDTQCENYKECESLVCSRATLSTNNDAKTSWEVAEDFERLSYTDQARQLSLLTPGYCTLPLDGGLCNDLCTTEGQVQRSVGCAAHVTAQYTTNPRVIYTPNPTTCGKGNNNAVYQGVLPYTSLPCSGFGKSCGYQFQCALNGDSYSTNACNSLTCPEYRLLADTTTNDGGVTRYNMTYSTRCVATHNNTLVSTQICQAYRSSYLDSFKEQDICSATPQNRWCTSAATANAGMELLLDFTPYPKVWDAKKKTFSDFITRNSIQQYTPRYETNCRSITANSVSINIVIRSTIEYTSAITRNNYNIINDGTIELSLTYSISGPLGTQAHLFFIPTDSNLDGDEIDYYQSVIGNAKLFQQLPYFISTVILKQYDNSVRVRITADRFPMGTYRAVLLVNRGQIAISQYSIVIVKEYIRDTRGNIIHQEINQQDRIAYLISAPPTDTKLQKQTQQQQQQQQNVVMTTFAVNDVSTPSTDPLCNTKRCYNGYCVVDTNPTTQMKTARCECLNGFTSDNSGSCTISVLCNINQISTITPAQCNLQRGVLIPSFRDTSWGLNMTLPTQTQTQTPSQDDNKGLLNCTTCHCFGNWDSTDGCNTCNLQCGLYGRPNADCTACECNAPYFGTQCEFTSIQFSTSYAHPPPILQLLYTTKHTTSSQPKTQYEAVQIETFKRTAAAEVATDFGLSIDDVQVVKFGTEKKSNHFMIIFSLAVSVAYDTALNVIQQEIRNNPSQVQPLPVGNNTALRLRVAEKQYELLQDKIDNFFTLFNQVKVISTNFIMPYNTTYIVAQPSFNVSTLLQRTSAYYMQQSGDDDVDYNELQNEADIVNMNNDNQQVVVVDGDDDDDNLFMTLQTNNDILTAANKTIAAQYWYRFPTSMQGVSADASGSFLGFVDTYDTSKCATPVIITSANSAKPNCPQTPSLSDAIPNPKTPSNVDWTLIGIIIFLVILVVIVIICVVLCCAWVKQCLCFNDWEGKRMEKLQNEIAELSAIADPTPQQEHRLKKVQYELRSLRKKQRAKEGGAADGNTSLQMTATRGGPTATGDSRLTNGAATSRTGRANSKLSNTGSNGSATTSLDLPATASGASSIPNGESNAKRRSSRGARSASTAAASRRESQQHDPNAVVGAGSSNNGGRLSNARSNSRSSRSGSAAPKPQNNKSAQAASPTPVVVIEDEEEDEDDDGFESEYDEAEAAKRYGNAPSAANKKMKRKSLFIGGIKKVETNSGDAPLPPGWVEMSLEGKSYWVNEEKMQSSKVRPNPDGSLPEQNKKEDDYSSMW